MRRSWTVLCVVAALATAVACSSNNPSSPSSTNSISLTGSVVASGGGSAGTNSVISGPTTSGTLPTGLTITIVGTGTTVQVNANGQFSINGVPSGTINLRLNGPGISALMELADLEPGQTVTITITLNGVAAELDSDRRRGPSGEQLEGRVESLPPTTAAKTFMVAGRLVTTDANTTFVMQGAAATFADLAIGQRVHVKGTPGATSLLATNVNIQNTNTDIGTNLNGIVSGFSGTATAFQFTVNNQLIKGDAATVFFGNSAFADLANGARVEVKGSLRDGFVYATRIHVN